MTEPEQQLILVHSILVFALLYLASSINSDPNF